LHEPLYREGFSGLSRQLITMAFQNKLAFNYQDYFDYGPAVSEVEDKLVIAYQIEYVLGELNRRKHSNPRLQFKPRVTYWENKLQEDALDLIVPAAQHLLQAMKKWIAFHSGSGFAEQIVQWGPTDTGIDKDGKLRWGGKFTRDLIKPLIDFIVSDCPMLVESLFDELHQNMDEAQAMMLPPEEELEQYKKEYIRDYLESYEWSSLYDLITTWKDNWGEDIWSTFLKERLFPMWREHWTGVLDPVEKNVADTAQRVEAAIESRNLNDLFVAVNIALQVRHVGGRIALGPAGLSSRVLVYLSHMPTGRLDELCDIITGQDWEKNGYLSVEFVGRRFSKTELRALTKYASREFPSKVAWVYKSAAYKPYQPKQAPTYEQAEKLMFGEGLEQQGAFNWGAMRSFLLSHGVPLAFMGQLQARYVMFGQQGGPKKTAK
jgi:hypothetical protein